MFLWLKDLKSYTNHKKGYIKGNPPVIIEAGALLKDTVSDEILIQLNFHSVSDKKIKALKVIVKTKNQSGMHTTKPEKEISLFREMCSNLLNKKVICQAKCLTTQPPA